MDIVLLGGWDLNKVFLIILIVVMVCLCYLMSALLNTLKHTPKIIANIINILIVLVVVLFLYAAILITNNKALEDIEIVEKYYNEVYKKDGEYHYYEEKTEGETLIVDKNLTFRVSTSNLTVVKDEDKSGTYEKVVYERKGNNITRPEKLIKYTLYE